MIQFEGLGKEDDLIRSKSKTHDKIMEVK